MSTDRGPAAPGRQFRQARFTRPEGACELLLIRHGESEAAVAERPFPLVDGQGDPALAPEGLLQARLLADRLDGAPIRAIYITPLRRTRQTAEPLARRLGLVPVVERDLREVHLGEWEGGRFRMKAATNDPIYRRVFEEERWDVIPGAEPRDAFHRRIDAAIRRIAATHPDELVAVVAHGGSIGQVLGLAAQSRDFAFVGADNASISQLVVWGDRWIVRRFNDTAHLASPDRY